MNSNSLFNALFAAAFMLSVVSGEAVAQREESALPGGITSQPSVSQPDDVARPSVRPGSMPLANPIRQTRASIDLVCGSKTFTISTGTGGGACQGTKTEATCNDPASGDSGGTASCKDGCKETSGTGSCTAK